MGLARSLARAAPVLAALLALAVPGSARSGPPAPGFRLSGPEGGTQRLELPVGNARILDLDTDVRDVLLSSPKVAEAIVKTPRRIYLLGIAVGSTNAFFFDRRGRRLLRLAIRVTPDLAPIREALARLIPNEKIEVSAVNGAVALSGNVHSARAAEDARQIALRFVGDDEKRVVSMLKLRAEQQVMLSVRIAEMQREVVKQLGIDLQTGTPGRDDFVILSGTGPSTQTFARITANIGQLFGLGGPFANATLFLNALEREGLVRTLAEPNLTAVSGEPAKFLVGGEFPIPISSDNDSRTTVVFKEFGVLVTFTPVVLDSGMVSLRMLAEVSRLSNEGAVVLESISIPSLTVRRSETTVEMPDGGSLVIAGLLQNRIDGTSSGLPILKNLPVLGALFRSVAFNRGDTELVVVVTPRLVRPITDQPVALPTDGFAPGSDIDLYVYGRLQKTYRRPDAAAPAPPGALPLRGPLGYIME